MAGYSGTPLERKLGVKDGQTVFLDHPPKGFTLEAPTTTRLPRHTAITLTFHTDRRALERRLPTLVERTEQAGMIWVCWPKQAAVKAGRIESDLDEAAVRALGLAAGVVDVKVCAIDEVWSGLKFVRRLADRTS
jgi:hypothetical protein